MRKLVGPRLPRGYGSRFTRRQSAIESPAHTPGHILLTLTLSVSSFLQATISYGTLQGSQKDLVKFGKSRRCKPRRRQAGSITLNAAWRIRHCVVMKRTQAHHALRIGRGYRDRVAPEAPKRSMNDWSRYQITLLATPQQQGPLCLKRHAMLSFRNCPPTLLLPRLNRLSRCANNLAVLSKQDTRPCEICWLMIHV